jgi:hypothetical protein
LDTLDFEKGRAPRGLFSWRGNVLERAGLQFRNTAIPAGGSVIG